jgi:uncharacterized protein
MKKYGIESAILVPEMAVSADFRMGNKELFEAVRNNEGLYGYLAANPNYPRESIQMMRSALASRKFPALAFFCGASRPYPNADDYREILNAHRRFGKPVFVNVPNAEAVESAEEMAREFPTIKFIFGSMGGSEWKRLMPCGRTLNISLETSGSFDAEKIEEAVANYSPGRILFGSGLPVTDPACMLALIQSSDLPKSTIDKILYGNAKKLFGLDAADDWQPEPEEE